MLLQPSDPFNKLYVRFKTFLCKPKLQLNKFAAFDFFVLCVS